MSKRDVFHSAVKQALEKDGWTITADPFWIEAGGISVAIDLAVPISAYETFFQLPIPKSQVEDFQIRLIIYDPLEEKVVLWKK